MCYHKLFIFSGCGHDYVSLLPLGIKCPQCLVQSSSSSSSPPLSLPAILPHKGCQSDNIPSAWELEVSQSITRPTQTKEAPTSLYHSAEIDSSSLVVTTDSHGFEDGCTARLTHPLHTYLIHSLCTPCTLARARRLTRYEAKAIVSGMKHEPIGNRSQDRAQQQLKSGPVSDNRKRKMFVLNPETSTSEQRNGVSNPGATLTLETLYIDSLKNKIKAWTKSPTNASSPSQGSDYLTFGRASGVEVVKETQTPKPSWLMNPLLGSSLNLQIDKAHDDDTNSQLSPEHFAVPDLLHGSQESLTIDGLTSRKDGSEAKTEGRHDI